MGPMEDQPISPLSSTFHFTLYMLYKTACYSESELRKILTIAFSSLDFFYMQSPSMLLN